MWNFLNTVYYMLEKTLSPSHILEFVWLLFTEKNAAQNMASLLKAALASAEEYDDDAHNHYDFAFPAASFLTINKEMSETSNVLMLSTHFQALISLYCII